jgi:translation initiation factor IF-2
MNVTELARKIKLPTGELFDVLPLLGFDIGRRAIKINDAVANKIINNWPSYRRQLELLRAQARETEAQDALPVEKKTVAIPQTIVVRDFADKAGLSVSTVLAQLMKSGIFVSMNEKIDFDTAAIIGADLNLEVVAARDNGASSANQENRVKTILASETKEHLRPRPPVIVVMGHVDHGKTKLLDAIRQTDVVAGEAGGITQHIGAYQIERQGRKITFIDTPGHEVFTAMRSRGAKVADVAILVVAADDGVKPQTVEACRIIEQTKLPFVVAINKIDKPEADIEKTKSELATKLKITPEEWGGKTICLPVSAKEGTGVAELLDNILLMADMEKDNIVANPLAPGVGTVIESHIDRGEGPVATILVQNGTLHAGDIMWLDAQPLGKIRLMRDYTGAALSAALPATPVRIAGLKAAPNIGDIIESGHDDERVRLSKVRKYKSGNAGMAHVRENADSETAKKLNIIIKSDVLGSAEAIEESLEKLSAAAVRVQVLKKGLGAITEGDIDRALASNAIVVGFNTPLPPAVETLARDKGVAVKTYRIIYELVNDIKKKMEELAGAETVRHDIARAKVLAIFKTENAGQVIGGHIESGVMEPKTKVEVWRGTELVAAGEITNVQAGKQNVTRVEAGQECGLAFNGQPVIAVGDILRAYREEKKEVKL